MGFSSIGGYSLYSQQYAANNAANNGANNSANNSTTTRAEMAKSMLHDVRSQIAGGTMGEISDSGDTVSISNGARVALAALLALQKEREAQDLEKDALAKDAQAAQAQHPAEERIDLIQRRSEAVMRAYFG